jgi:hypothetical protein
LIDASCPSKRLAAVTMRTGLDSGMGVLSATACLDTRTS